MVVKNGDESYGIESVKNHVKKKHKSMVRVFVKIAAHGSLQVFLWSFAAQRKTVVVTSLGARRKLIFSLFGDFHVFVFGPFLARC